jgi:hypothetical protein
MNLAAKLHNERKERLARFANAAAAREARKRAEVQAKQAAALEKYLELKKPEPDPEPEPDPVVVWVEKQKEIHKPAWFSVVSAAKVCRSGAPSIRSIQRATCDVYGVKLSDLLSARRHAPIIRPRMVSMFLAKELTDLSLARIGHATGGRDHSSVINAVERIGLLCKSDSELARTVAQIRERLA